MNKVEIHFKGMLEPLLVNEPFQATAMNMSAAMNNNLKFFSVKDMDDHPVFVAIDQIVFMRNSEDI